MPTIQDFTRSIQQTEQRGGYVDVNRQGELEIKGTGFFGKIASWFRSSREAAAADQRVMEAFVSKLKQEYGPDFVDALPAQLNHTPLSSRLASQLLEAGSRHQTQFRDLNQVKINELGRKTDTFAQMFNEIADKQGFNIPLDGLNVERLLDKIGEDIERAGRRNTHAVSTPEAYRLAEDRVERFIAGKMALSNQIDQMTTLPKADRTMLRELAMNHEMTPDMLTMLSQNYGQAAQFMRTIVGSEGLDTRAVLTGLARLETIILDAKLMEAGVDTAPLNLLLRTGLAVANRDYGVQPDAILEQLSSPAGKELSAALSMFMSLDEDSEKLAAMGGRSVQLEELKHIVGEACGLSVDQIEKASMGMPHFEHPEQIPNRTATVLGDTLGLNLPRPSGLNSSGTGIFRQAFQDKVLNNVNEMLRDYVPDANSFEGNISKQLALDAPRGHKYTFNGQSYQGKDDLEKLKTDLNQKFSPQEVKTLTAISHQGLAAPFFTSIFEGLGPFKGMPNQSNTGKSSFEYTFSKDQNNNLTVDVTYKLNIDHLNCLDGKAPVALNTENSHYGFSFSLEIPAETIQRDAPQARLQDPIRYDYAFHEPQLVQEKAEPQSRPEVRKDEQKQELSQSVMEGLLNEQENARWRDGIIQLLQSPTPTAQEFLQVFGYEFKSTRGSGDCFYDSIRHATGEALMQETRNMVHFAVGNFLQQLPEDRKIFYADLQTRYDEGRIQKPATGPGDNDAYGTMDECLAVARVYNRPVVVLTRTKPAEETLDLSRRPIIHEPDGSQRDMVLGDQIPDNAIVLVHSGGLHWDGAVKAP